MRKLLLLLAVQLAGCVPPKAIDTAPGIGQPTPSAQTAPPAQPAFDDWLAAFREDAAAQGISAATLDAALTGITPVERVIELDRRQPEFLQTFSEYLERRVNARQVARGQALLLDRVEQRGMFDQQCLAARHLAIGHAPPDIV